MLSVSCSVMVGHRSSATTNPVAPNAIFKNIRKLVLLNRAYEELIFPCKDRKEKNSMP